MVEKEAKARIKINHTLENSGWRFFDSEKGPSNIQLEPNIKITTSALNDLGDDFEKTRNGFVDYLLLDDKGRPFVVLEAKKENTHPLTAKEQARRYANSVRAHYIILSNGNIHYFWNLSKGNPEMITVFPTYESLIGNKSLTSDPAALIRTKIDKYYIALSQDPNLFNSNLWKSGDDNLISNYCFEKNLRILRKYQIDAICSVQKAVADKKNRFLFEMATGTGKTLVAAAIAKLFIRSEVVNRVLFFVDRIELENQAVSNIKKYLSKDGVRVVKYKEDKEDWRSADIVVTTIQAFAFGNKYQRLFSPSDFDLVISDEAHRSLGSSNRAILEYFIGYKLGLTATPKNYLKGVSFSETDPREVEKRLLLDTYHIFGCDSGTPTFSYTLNQGVKDGYLVSPIIFDARSEITTKLLSDEGLVIEVSDDDVEVFQTSSDGKQEKILSEKSYEKSFFSESTNKVFCQTFLENAERDPISNEVGKSIVFCVNVDHARKITEILNEMADALFPGMYNSDFAVQITYNIELRQEMTINFANNNLNGHTKFLDDYNSSKSRVAVTVGMMTTGYDCEDILNIGLCRPVFSPSDFIQMKGRGTRLFGFKYEGRTVQKTHFHLFDFFGVCEYFENDFKYDEKLKLNFRESGHPEGGGLEQPPNMPASVGAIVSSWKDSLASLDKTAVGNIGMKIDRKFYENFEEKIKQDENISRMIANDDEKGIEYYLQTRIFDKPVEFFTIRKLEKALNIDRRLSIKEIVLNLLGKLDGYKTKEELMSDEFSNFILLNKEELEPYSDIIPDLESLFQAYILDSEIRNAVKAKKYQPLINSPLRNSFRKVKDVKIRNMNFLDYVNDYANTNNINCESFN